MYRIPPIRWRGGEGRAATLQRMLHSPEKSEGASTRTTRASRSGYCAQRHRFAHEAARRGGCALVGRAGREGQGWCGKRRLLEDEAALEARGGVERVPRREPFPAQTGGDDAAGAARRVRARGAAGARLLRFPLLEIRPSVR
jgi:hypothetical protein